MRKVFISYARQNKPDVDQLVEHLRVLGCDTWHDSSLHGGQDWWEEILHRIADADTFIAIISRDALSSTACRREFDWAELLDKPVIPVAVEPLPKALPRRFSRRQIVDYSDRESRDRAALTLAGGLATLPAPPPLPDPLPEQPAAPLSYLIELVDLVSQPEPLDHRQQRDILNQLEPALCSIDPEERRGGRDILEMLGSRDELYADVDRTINRLKDMSAGPLSIRSSDESITEASTVAVAAQPSTSIPDTVLDQYVESPEGTTQQREPELKHVRIDAPAVAHPSIGQDATTGAAASPPLTEYTSRDPKPTSATPGCAPNDPAASDQSTGLAPILHPPASAPPHAAGALTEPLSGPSRSAQPQPHQLNPIGIDHASGEIKVDDRVQVVNSGVKYDGMVGLVREITRAANGYTVHVDLEGSFFRTAFRSDQLKPVGGAPQQPAPQSQKRAVEQAEGDAEYMTPPGLNVGDRVQVVHRGDKYDGMVGIVQDVTNEGGGYTVHVDLEGSFFRTAFRSDQLKRVNVAVQRARWRWRTRDTRATH